MTLVPFISLLLYDVSIDKTQKIYIPIIILVFIAILIKIIFIITANKTLPVLHQIWALWPESHYDIFLTVPHLSDIERKDKKKDDNKYWKPDRGSPLSHQPSHYAKGKNTLQEVILHLAIFDYLFHPSENNNLTKKKKNKKKNKYKKSLKMNGWFYLFSPAIISYILLLFSFFISAFFYPTECTKNIPVLLRYPFWYAPLVIIWFAITANMIFKQISFLENLQEDIRDGYYNAHLDLIPQQILSVIAKVPSDRQISKGIEQVESILRWVQAAALVTFFMLLEVFSSGF
jgi:hypothetical protein